MLWPPLQPLQSLSYGALNSVAIWWWYYHHQMPHQCGAKNKGLFPNIIDGMLFVKLKG